MFVMSDMAKFVGDLNVSRLLDKLRMAHTPLSGGQLEA